MAGNNVITATSISPVVVNSAQLGTSEAALYTVPGSTSVKIATASLCNVSSLIAPPVLTLGTTASSGGTFAAGTYFWKVTAKSASGETLGSNEVSATLVANGTQALSWTAPAGWASFNIYFGTSAGNENILVANVTTTSFTDTGGGTRTTATMPTVNGYAFPVTVFLSIVNAAGTLGDGTHRVMHNFTLNGNDTFFFPQGSLPGAMLGPGDRIAGYCSVANAVDFVLTGTVHA